MSQVLFRRPLGLAGVSLALGEATLALVGVRLSFVSAALLLLAPGLVLIPLLPARTRESVTASVAAVPALGFAASSVVLVSIAAVGIPLTGTAVRLALVALVVLALVALPAREPALSLDRSGRWGAAGLLGAVLLGAVLQERVIGGSPVPGNDWAKYLLYADEVRRQGALLIDNPFWMLGVPFREEPAVPAVYGSYLALTGHAAGVLAHGIWAFAGMAILSMYALVRSFWGETVAVLAAGLWAVLPVNHDILGWHGLPNAAAIALMALVLLYLAVLLRDGLNPASAAGFALILVAIAATHRLSALVVALVVGLTVAAGLIVAERRRLARDLGLTAALVLGLGAAVAYDLWTRGRTFGGTQGHEAYLSAKVDLGLVASDLTYIFSGVVLVAVPVCVWWARRDRALIPVLCMLAVVAALGYAWVVDVPVAYFRMTYFLPLALVPLAALALTRLTGGRWAAPAGAALCLAIAPFAWVQADNVREFYAFASRSTVGALDRVEAALGPREVVVADRCWSFLATWLLHTPTIAALEPEDIQPKAELVMARRAKAILAGGAAGRRSARRLGARFAIIDPTCADIRGRPVRERVAGRPLFVSERLAVMRLPQASR